MFQRASHASVVAVPYDVASWQSNSEGLDLVVEAIAKAGYTGRVVIGMDVAASEFYSAEDKVACRPAPHRLNDSTCVNVDHVGAAHVSAAASAA